MTIQLYRFATCAESDYIYQEFKMKLKVLIFSGLALAVFSCRNEPDPKETQSAQDTLPSRFSQLSSLFAPTNDDTLYVHSAWDINSSYKFFGKPMDSAHIFMLPYNYGTLFNWNKDFGACLSFPLDSSHTALLSRVPGEYVSSALSLFVFDKKKDSITLALDVADCMGDAGEAMDHSSCLFRDKDKNLMILTYYWSSYDHTVNDTADHKVDHWHNYYLSKLSSDKLDTLSKDSAEIVGRYPRIIKKLYDRLKP